MEAHDQQFIIGIDLGTTNSAVAYVDLRAGITDRQAIQIFHVPQLIGPGEVSTFPVLPSFLYIPSPYDLPQDAVRLPWPDDGNRVVGTFARDHGANIPGRLVSSAKSWLCHGGVDRRAKILPWGAAEEVRKVSPVQATAAFLTHIRAAWNHAWADDDLALEQQKIVLTVPASFDEVARDLTVEAARLAGLPDITLIEEPVAAFYSWLKPYEKDWRRFVKPGELILVCDVGGGTTDFTLISLKTAGKGPRFERIAVGDHLILGGDNMDLALAHSIESKLGNNRGSLRGDRWKTLCHQCRQAKEAILEGVSDRRRVTLVGEGGGLVAGTVTAELDRQAVEEIILKGFFPQVTPNSASTGAVRKGIAELGLPYEQDPAITRHLGRFLDRHRKDVTDSLDRTDHAPDLILFNGGSLKPRIVQEKIRSAVGKWFGMSTPGQPRILENPDPDLAVAMGAAYYGMVKIGHGVRVGSGSARSYYLGIGVPDRETEQSGQRRAICLVERGLEEGSRIELSGKEFEVLANQPVSFDSYSSSYRSGDKAGDIVTLDDSMTALPPIQTVVEFGKKGIQTSIPVQLEAEFTEIGTLALWCASLKTPHRWQLQFQLRDTAPGTQIAEGAVLENERVENALAIVENGLVPSGDKRRLDSLAKDISAAVGMGRDLWPLGLIRKLGDKLLDLMEVRRLAPAHESRWYNLVGFCLRPGFGDRFDGQRLKRLLEIYRQGPVFAKNPQVRSEWYIMWRRIAGGLSAGQQRQYSQDLAPWFFPRTGKRVKTASQERVEAWMLVANMERLSAKDKVRWGSRLLSEISARKGKPQRLWSLSRIGARALLYGPADRVVPPDTASEWIDELIARQWSNPKPVAAALAQMARKTGDRMRDLDEGAIARVIGWMTAADISRETIDLIENAVPIAPREETAIFGESLPAGLILHVGGVTGGGNSGTPSGEQGPRDLR